MLQNFSHKFIKNRSWFGILLPIWVLASFFLVQVIVSVIYNLLLAIGVSFRGVNESVFNTVVGVIVYGLTILIVIGVPLLVKKSKPSLEELGLHKTPRFLDIFLAPAGFVVYLIISALLTAFAMQFLTFIDFDQVQETGFDQLTQRYEFVLAFIVLVVIAPLAEELLFRGYLLGKLRKHVRTWLAVLITSVVFAFVHLAWNVGIDVFALSLVLCLLRVWTGSLWPSILLHMIKNGIAFYLLFINPTFLGTLVG